MTLVPAEKPLFLILVTLTITVTISLIPIHLKYLKERYYGVKILAFKKELKGQGWHNNIFQNSFPQSCTLPERDDVLMGKSWKEEELRFSKYRRNL